MFKNNKIFIFGMARSGYEAAKLLATRNNEIILNDKNPDQDKEHIEELKKLGVKLIFGEYDFSMLDNIDYIIKNPGIKDSHELISYAKEKGIPVMNEIEMAYRLLPRDITLIGVTGSNGKTTTTSLIYEILKNAKLPVTLAGNIGYPLSAYVKDIKSKDILLMEISIQQLCNFDKFKTNISVLTNIFDAHLDFVGSKENYINIKKRIFNHHTNDDLAVLNYDNDEVLNNTNDILSHKEYFSKNNKNVKCYIFDNYIYYDGKKLICIDDVLLKGNHNYENVMAAIIVAKRLNVSNKIIVDTLKNFKSVEHRIEFVRTLNDVKIYNDSKATNVTATQIALSSFREPTILLLGGLDRGHSFDGLIEYMKNVKLVVCYGETKNRIKEFCDKLNIECIVKDTLVDATEEALNNSVSGDVILLSPACASWDQFKDFEERGRVFKEYINNK
ncbi:MAG: UDP-N-acetylmuramoyl-L-alanine--D-glutamate ligase [Bacilli bacterium]|nr:UDP-N-acetylmuramoyl-L-alanine--D-glutamate ligase [Bacilli bacterium]